MRTNTSGEALGIYASGFVGGISILAIPVFAYITLKKINDDDFAQKFGTLTDEINKKSKVSLLWNVLMLIKWLITAVVLMTLSNYPSIQVLLLLFLSWIFQIIIFKYKPFELPQNNRLRLINELFISCYLYFYILLLDFNQAVDSEKVHQYSSWGLVGVLGASGGLNLIFYLKIVFTNCKTLTVKKC